MALIRNSISNQYIHGVSKKNTHTDFCSYLC